MTQVTATATSGAIGHPHNSGVTLSPDGLTEAYQAERFVEAYGDRLRYDHVREKWFLYRAPLWVLDPDGEVYRLAIECARCLQAEASGIQDSKTRDKVVNFAKACQSSSGLQNVLRIARNLPPIANIGGQWDPDPWLLGAPNGVVDLKTGKLRPGTPEDMITLSVTVDYDPEAPCPLWEKFQRQIFRCNTALIRYVQRVFSYCLTGLTTEQIWCLLYGTGANGKSTLLNVLRAILGPYGKTVPFSTIQRSQRSNIPDDVAALAGKRVGTVSETIEAARLDEARIKALTGGDLMSARALYGQWFDFKPQLKLLLSCNHKPTVQDDTHGFWRRVHVIPFTRCFEGRWQDDKLFDKLMTEAPGILRWMVQGCLKWQRDGLMPPDIVTAAANTYREESDPLVDFLAECCEEAPEATCGATELYGAYSQWTRNRGLDRERLSSTAFGRRMAERFERDHARTGNFYKGLKLRTGNWVTGSLRWGVKA